MNTNAFDQAINLAQKLDHVYIATAGIEGMPHITAAATLEQAPDEHVLITEWFCPGTVANLNQNRSVAIAVWDFHCDVGYQLLGRVERIDDMAILDGYAPGIDTKHKYPQSEKQLLIKVEKVLDFTLAPHCNLAV